MRYVEGQRLNFIWDHENHYAEISSQRLNRAVRFVFLDNHRQPVADADFMEFSLDSSQVTDEVYVRVLNYSAGHDAGRAAGNVGRLGGQTARTGRG